MRVASLFLTDNCSLQTGQELSIDSKPIAFLQKPLLEGCSFRNLAAGHDDQHAVWTLAFFNSARWEQTVCVVIQNLDPSALPTDKDQAKQITNRAFGLVKRILGHSAKAPRGVGTACFTQSEEETMPEHARLAASLLLRGSATLEDADYASLGSHSKILVDGNGFSFFATNRGPGHDNFERLVVAYALSIAYRESMDAAVTELAQCDGKVASMRNLYRAATSFNARYFFSRPIKQSLVFLPRAWEQFEKLYKSTGRNDEFLRQLDASRRLLEAEREAEEVERERKVMRRLTVFGTIIALISLVGLLQITPEQASDFFHGWGAAFSSN